MHLFIVHVFILPCYSHLEHKPSTSLTPSPPFCCYLLQDLPMWFLPMPFISVSISRVFLHLYIYFVLWVPKERFSSYTIARFP